MKDLEKEWPNITRLGDTVFLAIEKQTITGEVVGIDLNGVRLKKNKQCSEYYPWKYVKEIIHKGAN